MTGGRITGEFWSRDFGVGVALRRCLHGRFGYELFVLLGSVSLTIGFHPRRRSARH